jgi:hypothetical protein
MVRQSRGKCNDPESIGKPPPPAERELLRPSRSVVVSRLQGRPVVSFSACRGFGVRVGDASGAIAAAGVRAGDVVLSIDKARLHTSPASFLCYHAVRCTQTRVRDHAAAAAAVDRSTESSEWALWAGTCEFRVAAPEGGVGVKLKNAPDGPGVLISRAQMDGAARRAGLRAGDIILAINGVPCEEHEEAVACIDRAGSDAMVVYCVPVPHVPLGADREGGPDSCQPSKRTRASKAVGAPLWWLGTNAQWAWLTSRRKHEEGEARPPDAAPESGDDTTTP